MEKATFYTEKSLEDFLTVSLGVRSTGYRLYALGYALNYLGDREQALEFYKRSITYAEQGNFIQLKAITLIGLAILCRDQKQFEKSLKKNIEAIELLEKY